MINSLLRIIGHQNWMRYGVRDRLIRSFRNPDTVDSFEFETNFFGLKYNGDLNSYLDWCAYYYGAYEKEFLFFLRETISKRHNPVFIDVGANEGHHSLFMSRFCEQVLAFEPNPNANKKLFERMQRNDVTNVSVHCVGLGINNEEMHYFQPNGHNKATGSFVEGYSSNNKEMTLLKVVNGDEYLSKFCLDEIHLIKIDVEGFEKNVITGLEKTIQKYRPILTLEFSPSTKATFSDYDELMGFFPNGYKIWKISTNRPHYIMFNSPNCKLQSVQFSELQGDLFLCPEEKIRDYDLEKFLCKKLT